ncbi:MAG: hypothetical protein KKC75_06375 [Nanoarchaeota archaeon]|nr:hypothetical protein [Nanoarchaeota archaeon]MBU1004468.1 hypothetical protein [Nanoarchaeota archaeon]MBU1946262.1 hypothetical protein [Nanoarchaeota archaeon]
MVNNKLISIFLTILLLLPIFTIADGWAPEPPITDDDTPAPAQNTTNPYSTYTNTLEITNLNVIVDRNTVQDVKNGESISQSAEEESNIEFDISVKNLYTDEIRSIEATVTINNIGDDDIDEDSESFTLSSGNSKTVDVDLDIPLIVDEKDYTVKIHLEGRDSSNNLHILDWQLKLSVDKENHKLKITKASLTPSSVSCSSPANLEITLLNLGSKDEEIKLEITSDTLGINLREDNIEMGTGTDNDAEYERTFTLSIPAIERGSYPIKIKAAYNDGKDSTTKEVYLNIDSCNKAIQKSTSLALKSLPPNAKETISLSQITAASETTISYSYKEPLALFLTIMLIIVLGLLIFLFGAIIIILNKPKRTRK